MSHRRKQRHHAQALAGWCRVYAIIFGERCRSIWFAWKFRKQQPRISTETRIADDGSVVKRIKVTKARSMANYFSFTRPRTIRYPLLLIAIFILIMLLLFGEAYSNRGDNIIMTIGSWGNPVVNR